MKEEGEEESAVGYMVQSNLKQLLLKTFTFSVSCMLSYLNKEFIFIWNAINLGK